MLFEPRNEEGIRNYYIYSHHHNGLSTITINDDDDESYNQIHMH
jgi:hypothetical protein